MKEKLKLDESNRLFQEGLNIIPGGVTGVRRPYNFIPKEYPIFFRSAQGGKVTDVDGNDYVDMMATYGAIVLGHRFTEVDDAVIAQIQNNGFCLTLTQHVQNQLAQKLCDLIPSCEKAVIVKTGSDATLAAIRIARAHTGRTKILRCGYHGWHDWSVELKAGVPQKVFEDVHEFAYNDLDQVADLMKQYGDQVAGIILWPIGTPLGKEVQMPKAGFLEGVRSLADQYGSVLIYDELRSGFRVDLGGAQKLFGVIPDITAVGKAMGNGYAISAVVGKKEVMKVVENKVFISSTFFPNSLDQVAALKTIEILERDQILDALRQKGEKYCRKIAEIVSKSGVPCTFTGAPWMPFIMFCEKSDMVNMKLRFKFYTSLIRSHMFLSPHHHGYFIYQHTDEDMDALTGGIAEALDEIKREYYS
jgi:glutamate-1-semialdehyde aminotransferase